MDEARCEEATQSDQQQECILSGGVYLRHRLEKRASQKSACSAFPSMDTIPHHSPACNLRRAGVLACKKLSLNSTRHSDTDRSTINGKTRFIMKTI